MKISDDYKAKIKLWAANPQIIPDRPVIIPNFKSRKFCSHAEMNEWKASVLREIAKSAATHG